MIIVALSTLDGHIYQSNPATAENKDVVKANIVSDMKSCGLVKDIDYTLEEMTEAEFQTFMAQ